MYKEAKKDTFTKMLLMIKRKSDFCNYNII